MSGTAPVRVSRRESGRPGAPTVVLANSLGSTSDMWDAVLPGLEEHFRVVRYDQRGHGASPAPPGPYSLDDLAADLLALLDDLGVARAHLVGLSLGGMTALHLASRAPGRVDRLVVLCATSRFDSPAPWLERAATVRAAGSGAVAAAVVGRWFTPEYLAERPEERARWEAMVAATPAEGYAACCEAIAGTDLGPDLFRVTAPTLAVAGAEDPATTTDHLARIAEGVADGRLLVVPGAAHLACAEQPGVVGPAIVGHLLGGAPRTGPDGGEGI